MDSSKLGMGETIAGISGLALFVVMFLPWYGTSSIGGFGLGGRDLTAWEAFSVIDVLLFLVCVVVVGLTIVALAESNPQLPAPPARIVMGAGLVAVVLIAFRLVFTPAVGVAGFDVEFDSGREIGVFLGLIAAAGIAYGGWRASSGPDRHTPSASTGS